MSTLFTHAHLVSAGFNFPNGALLTEGNRIRQVFSSSDGLPEAEEVIDLKGKFLLPGFTDIHFHGRGGSDFCDGTDEAFDRIGKGKLKEGVTSFLATTLSVSRKDILTVCECAKRYAARTSALSGARILGIHLEGPFINPEGAGAQNPEFLSDPDLGFVEECDRIFPVRKVSFSPELKGSLEFTEALREKGIMSSCAHSTADYECFETMRRAGMKHITHFCNVVTPLHHLRPGVVGAGLLDSDVYVETITDGIHLREEMLRIILWMKGPGRVMMITDAMMASDMPDGMYKLGGLDVIVKDRKATLTNGRVAGSVLNFNDGLKRLRSLGEVPDAELIRVAGCNQCESLNLTETGKLAEGYFADLVVADTDWNVLETWVSGRKLYQR